VYDGQTRINA